MQLGVFDGKCEENVMNLRSIRSEYTARSGDTHRNVHVALVRKLIAPCVTAKKRARCILGLISAAVVWMSPSLLNGQGPIFDLEHIAQLIEAQRTQLGSIMVKYQVQVTQFISPEEITARINQQLAAARAEEAPVQIGAMASTVDCFWAADAEEEYFETVETFPDGNSVHKKALYEAAKTTIWRSDRVAGAQNHLDTVTIMPGRVAPARPDLYFSRFVFEDENGNPLARALVKFPWNAYEHVEKDNIPLYKLRDSREAKPSSYSELWLDGSRGFIPVRRKIVTNGRDRMDLEVRKFINVNGLWFPREIAWKTFWLNTGEPLAEYLLTVDDIKLNKDVPNAIFNLAWGPGTYVADRINNKEYWEGNVLPPFMKQKSKDQ